MEDCAGLLGKTMNSALYWLSHLIDMLLAFVFSITSLISALVAVDVVAVDVFAVDVVAVDVFAKCLLYLMVNRKNQFLLCNYDGLETCIFHWEGRFLLLLELRVEEGRKGEHHMEGVLFPLLF